ncbi:hypothetical protein V8C35DRAFT_294389 [Trichoderma chlorosporum]
MHAKYHMAADDFDEDQRSHMANEGILINRKRELNGQSSTLSANGGQRISPSYIHSNVSASKNDGRSVKSIVAWLESSATNADISRHSGDDIKSVHSVGTISSAGSNSSLLSRHTIPGAADVEEYSLTLLKYKKYYTEVPLGRCLDGHKQDEMILSSYKQPPNTSIELPRHLEPGYREETTLMNDEQPSPTKKGRSIAKEVHLFHRDIEDVLAF